MLEETIDDKTIMSTLLLMDHMGFSKIPAPVSTILNTMKNAMPNTISYNLSTNLLTLSINNPFVFNLYPAWFCFVLFK